jgi:RNA polymerase sigma-70 factor (sigma-E family)
MEMSSRTAGERWKAVHVSERNRELSALFDAHYSELRGLAFVILGDSHLAEEVVMDAFTKMFSSWTRVRRLDFPYGYLRRVVVNMCRGKIRRRRLESSVTAAIQRRAEIESSEWNAEHSDARLDVWEAVRRLPERQRLCVVLRYLEDMPEAEIAETLDCSIGTVKSQTSRARRSLEQMLGPQNLGGMA